MRIAFISSEVYPYMKTGGLADVSASLPKALSKLKPAKESSSNGEHDVRIIMPAYPDALAKAKKVMLKLVADFTYDRTPLKIWQSRLPGSRTLVYLVDADFFSTREGNPYVDEHGNDWNDNGFRFGFFCKVAKSIALNECFLNWEADLVHCNDWQTGLVPVFLQQAKSYRSVTPRCLFSIHNIAYTGCFEFPVLDGLDIEAHYLSEHALEFYGRACFLKAGCTQADWISTVSPSYAKEILSAEFAYGMEGVLQARQDKLSGILNGIDTQVWNPYKDENIARTYNLSSLENKKLNRSSLQRRMKLRRTSREPLFGFIGRLVEQKGVHLILEALPKFIERGAQAVILGSGDEYFEKALEDLAKRFPESVAASIGYDEALSHQINAGADIFMMPSLFEPCGLNQMYALRYGTVPVVHAVGGLRDSVVEQELDIGQADHGTNGFTFTADNDGLQQPFENAMRRAAKAYKLKKRWYSIQRNGLTADLSWKKSAQDYIELYQRLLSL